MNQYTLYRVRLVKGILMYTYVDKSIAENIIDAEDLFETKMVSGEQYVITITKV